MDSTLTGYLLPGAILGIVALVSIAIGLFQRRARKRIHLRRGTELLPSPSGDLLDYRPIPKTIPAIPSPVTPMPGAGIDEVPKPGNIDLTSNRRNMTESLAAIARKYSLNNFTLSTADGLLFGSSGGDTALADAATYSMVFKNDPLAMIPEVRLFKLTHKGSDLIGIVRTETPLKKEVIQQITADTQVVLNWWI